MGKKVGLIDYFVTAFWDFINGIRLIRIVLSEVDDEKNCFDQMVEVFKISKKIGRHRVILDKNLDDFYKDMIEPYETEFKASDLLFRLPYCNPLGSGVGFFLGLYCRAKGLPFNPDETDDSEDIADRLCDCDLKGCDVSILKHYDISPGNGYYDEDKDPTVEIFYGDDPSKDSIVVSRDGYTPCTLAYLEANDPEESGRMKSFLKDYFFREVLDLVDKCLLPVLAAYVADNIIKSADMASRWFFSFRFFNSLFNATGFPVAFFIIQ